MGSYKIKEMSAGMTNSERKQFPALEVYNMFDNEKTLEWMVKYNPMLNRGLISSVFEALSKVLVNVLPEGHTVKIDGLGVFSLSLEFCNSQQSEATEEKKDVREYYRVQAKSINLKVDHKLVDEINEKSNFERNGNEVVTMGRHTYTLQQRIERTLAHLEKHRFITLTEYANLNQLSRTAASLELKELVANHSSGIKSNGSGSHKVWVKA